MVFVISWLPNLARSVNNPKDLGPEDPYPKGSLRKEGKREDGSLDFSLRLVAPEGPADLDTWWVNSHGVGGQVQQILSGWVVVWKLW